ncbi:NADH:ubiquinone reductase (Na(+)-transporting) subunit F [Shewanella sp. UCD-KL12]|uniref:NADH:ubiquinone reductase (Na(+)-transporting) subunit F n=1 Tax=Shewanella sp. UCD-KL12 TaxID=1917163 RepID=UPI0009703CA9|nr:2Fe-2S iron-sulfur cluster-binding protein [Shewanella sp. UCD-KL12]
MSLIKVCHKWLSLLVGLQLLIWIGTGLFFNVMDHEKAKGTKYLIKQDKVDVSLSQLIEPQKVLNSFPLAVSLEQVNLLAKPYYLLTHTKGLYKHFKNEYTLVDAKTGKQVVIKQALANAIALSSYSGPGEITSTVKLLPPHEDRLKEKNPLWRVNFDDAINTSVYIDAGSGRLIGHANDDKRIIDLVFMLHFMDYAQERSFNNIQIIIFAIFTLFFALTGFIWVIESAFNGKYKLSAIFTNLATTRPVEIFNKNGKQVETLDMSSHENLLDSLLNHGIALPSTCAGGGTCGRCKIQTTEDVIATSADIAHFTADEIASGFRLACQHSSDELQALTLLDVTQASNHQLKLMSSEFISPYIKELKFIALNEQAIEFKAGAYMRFFIPAAKGVSVPVNLPPELMHHWQDVLEQEYDHLACSRNYSLANGDGKSNELVFTIKIQTSPNSKVTPGIGSSYICNLAEGQTIEAVGPFEEFFAVEGSNSPMVLIGAGSGMAPLKALIEEQLIKLNSKRPIHFYFGARTQVDLIYATQFEALAARYENFTYNPVLSRTDEHWPGSTGYVQDKIADDFKTLSKHGAISEFEFYLCGPTAMMNSSIEFLRAKGVDNTQIAFDDFS